MKDVYFTYYPQADGKEKIPLILNILSLESGRGEIVAFTGQSGCGKTHGSQALDVRIPLFVCLCFPGELPDAGTIREIVSFAEPEAGKDEERLGRALSIACADEFVGALDDGADTLLGERGSGLSEAQMQRLAIARAVFADAPVLLLDEATSAVDMDTERRLLENLRRLTDKTLVIVTHRQEVLSVCDRVVQFTENGVRTGPAALQKNS